jgi:hypothetical protein
VGVILFDHFLSRIVREIWRAIQFAELVRYAISVAAMSSSGTPLSENAVSGWLPIEENVGKKALTVCIKGREIRPPHQLMAFFILAYQAMSLPSLEKLVRISGMFAFGGERMRAGRFLWRKAAFA